MAPNYDAKAVADLMGVAFVRTDRGGARQGTRAAKPARLVIHVGDCEVAVIEMGNRGASKRAAVEPPSPAFIEKAVENGLPRGALRHVAEHIAGGDKAKASALEWGVVPKTTLERRETRLSPQESERTERIARLFVHARRALGTETEAREFLTARHAELDSRTPMEAAKTDLGARRVESILNALEYGLAL
jgi:putative toxin-antitoxin system antitoxin component (TIGR02293 family)